MAGAEKFARRSQLHFLWRLEPALRCPLVWDHRDGFLAWSSNGQSQRATCKTSLASRERLHESEHARIFQIRKLSARKFSVAARASRDHLSTAASGHPASGGNFVLHFPFPFVHARHLSGRAGAGDFLPQLLHPPRLKNGQFLWGLALMTLGLFQKIVLADTMLSGSADRVFDYPGPLIALDSWAGVLAFAGQIFFDFAGYSLCAIGAALTLGFHLKDNFRFPYAAIGFSDFWRRWHISLSTFLRDYLYIPLGGNQVRPVRAALNLVIVMFIGGLWHGAAWTFVVWGLLHGSYLVIERVFRVSFEHKPWASTLPVRVLAGFVTYAAVCIAWVFFRASDFTIASRMLGGMFGQHPHGDAILSTRELLQIGSVTAGVIAMHWAMRDNTFETAVMRLPPWTIAAIGSAMICAIILTQGSSNAFIYFQF